MKTTITLYVFWLFSSFAFADAGITYHGRILRPDNSPVTSSTTQFHIQIKSPGAEGCLLWEEFQTKNLSSTAGAFSVTIGDSSLGPLLRTQTNISNPLTGGNFTLPQVFSNRSPYTSGLNCDDSSGTYIPASTHGRVFAIRFRENNTLPWEELPPVSINYVPLAYNSIQLEGYRASEFLKIDPLAVYTPLTAGQVNTLMDIIAGTNSQYLRPSSTFGGDVSGTYNAISVNRIRGTNVVVTAPTTGQVLKFDGTNWVPSADDTGGAPGDASYAAKGVIQINTDLAVSGLTITGGVLSMPNVGTAGTYGSASLVPVITTDAKGRVTGVVNTTVDDTTKLPLAGGTMTGTINMGLQNITNATSVAATNFSGRNLILNDNDTNTATIRAPTDITANYALTLPVGAPQNGYVLSTDGTGQLSWIAAATGSMTSISSTNLYLTVDSTTPATPTLTVNVGTAANTVAAGNDSRIVGALQTTDYNADLAPAALCTTSQTSYWNTVSGTWACQSISVANFSGNLVGDVTGTQGATVVERIRGVNVVATAPTIGQILKFDGTNYVPSTDAGLIAETDPSVQAWAKTAPNAIFSTAGDVLNITTRIPSSPAAPVAGQDGQTLRWNNGTSQWEWFTPGVAGSGFTQGGNSFGATAVLGTNDNYALDFETNGTTRMTVLNSGNVGIGTSTPQARLDTSGTIRSTGTNSPSSGSGIEMSFMAGAGYLTSSDKSTFDNLPMSITGSQLTFATSPNGGVLTRMIVGSTGVGIGNISATSAIDIDGAITQRGMAAPAVSAAGRGRIYFDSTSNTFRISQNGSAYADILTSASAVGDITEVVAGAGLTGGATSGSASLAVGAGTGILVNADDIAVNVGTGANQIVQLNGSSQLPAVSGVNLTNLNADNIASGTLAIARGGTGATSANAALNNLLPSQATNAGRVLATDGNNTSWVAASTGTVTEVTSSNAYLSVATGTTTPALTLNVGTAANTVAAGDDSRIVNAVQQTAYAADLAPAALCTTVQTPYWNTVSDTWACQNINFSSSGSFVQNGNSFGSIATLGTNDNFGLNFETNGSARIRIDQNGAMTFGHDPGAPSSSIGFSFQTNPWDRTGNYTNIENDSNHNGVANTGTIIGQRNVVRIQFNQSRNIVVANRNTTEKYDGTMAESIGAENLSVGDGPGSTILASGSKNIVRNSTQTITTANALFADVEVNSGTVTNARGLYIDTLQGTNRWGIYQNGSSDNNFFAGNIGIGTGVTAPTTALDINGAITQRGMAAPAVAPAGQGRIYYDSGSNAFRVSQNGGAYTNLVGGGATTLDGLTDVVTNYSTTYNMYLGSNVGATTTSGVRNTAMGADALQNVTTADNTVAIGNQALQYLTTGNSNVGVGREALHTTSTGSNNTAVGMYVMGGNTTGSHNVAVGDAALGSGNSSNNVAIGAGALDRSLTAGSNTAIGYRAGRETTGASSGNIFIGHLAGPDSTTTISDSLWISNWSGTPTIYGDLANRRVGIATTSPGAMLQLGTAGTSLGTMRMTGNTSGFVQIQPAAAAGSWTMTLPASAGTSGQALTTNGSGVTSWTTVPANGGTFLATAGSPAAPGFAFSGDTNTGFSSPYADAISIDVNGSSRVQIDSSGLYVGGVRLSGTSSPNPLYPYYAFYTDEDTGMYSSASDTLNFTTGGTERMRISSGGAVSIGNTSTTHALNVTGSAGLSTGTAWTNTSDRRLKDIHGDYEYGLNEILKLNTVRFNYKKNNSLGLSSDHAMTGFIAQEVQKVIPDAVTVRDDGYLELNVDPIHWATVNAVQDLYGMCKMSDQQLQSVQRSIASLEDENVQLKKQVQELKDQLKSQYMDIELIKKHINLSSPSK